jgi:hypothetical protein
MIMRQIQSKVLVTPYSPPPCPSPLFPSLSLMTQLPFALHSPLSTTYWGFEISAIRRSEFSRRLGIRRYSPSFGEKTASLRRIFTPQNPKRATHQPHSHSSSAMTDATKCHSGRHLAGEIDAPFNSASFGATPVFF